MKRILFLLSLLLVIVCICAAGCTGSTVPPEDQTGTDDSTCLHIFSCNVDGAEVSLYDGKVMVDRDIVEDGVAIFELSPDTVVRSATVTAEGYERIPSIALDQLKAGENKIYYITLEKKAS